MDRNVRVSFFFLAIFSPELPESCHLFMVEAEILQRIRIGTPFLVSRNANGLPFCTVLVEDLSLVKNDQSRKAKVMDRVVFVTRPKVSQKITTIF